MKTLAFWVVMVVVLSLMPVSGETTEARITAGLVLHAFMSAVSALLIMSVMVNTKSAGLRAVIKSLGGPKTAWVAAGLASALGLVIEGAKELYPASGGFSVNDAAANVIGAAAWAIYAILSSAGRKRRQAQ